MYPCNGVFSRKLQKKVKKILKKAHNSTGMRTQVICWIRLFSSRYLFTQVQAHFTQF